LSFGTSSLTSTSTGSREAGEEQWGRQDDTELLDLAKVMEAIEALSNYMIFLLAASAY
jgi:hypothetical protein